jgi:hypothetical protein
MRKLFSAKRRVAVVAAAIALVLAGGGAAFAYFTSGGTGTGTGSVGTSASFVVAVSTPTGGPLLPGTGTETFTYTIRNPTGNGSQQATSAVITVAPDATAAAAGCLASWYNVDSTGTDTDTVTLNQTIAGGATYSGAPSVTLQLTNEPVDQDACENDAPVVTVTVS